MSLRLRILVLATGTAALVIVLAGVPIALLLRTQAYDDAERGARAAAQSTADYLSTGRYDDTVLSQYLDRLNSRGHSRVTVVMGDGDVLGAPLPDGATPAEHRHGDGGSTDHDRDDLGRVSSATTTQVAGGQLVQIDSQSTQGIAQVFALAPDSRVHSEVVQRDLLVAGAAIVLLFVAAGSAEVTSRRMAGPLERTAATAVRLSSGDLVARARVEGPVEVARVAVELNALADRIDELLAQERETIADLSHRLRTPLTAVRLGVEALAPGAAKDELEEQVASLERSLTRVIHAARRPQREGVHPSSDATSVIRERVDFWAPLSEDQGRTVSMSLPPGEVPVRAAAEDLAAVLDALIENVIAHTPEGTGFEIALRVEDGNPVVEVLDDGPGISQAALRRGRSDRGSTGLGLDVARTFAESTGGSLTLVDPPHGGVRLNLRASGEQREDLTAT